MEEAYVLNVLARAPSISTAQNVTLSGPASQLTGRRVPSEESQDPATPDSPLSWRRREVFGPEPLTPSQTGPGSGRMTPKGHSDLAVGSSQSAMPARGRAGTWVVELYFHPTLASASVPLGPNRGDLATLLSPAVRRAIEERGWVRGSYATLQEAR
jgi:hypothetical protein